MKSKEQRKRESEDRKKMHKIWTKPLNPKELAFCREYLSNGFVGSHAVVKAGYSTKAVSAQFQSLMKRPHIKRYLNIEMSKAAKKAEITRDEVIQELKACLLRDAGELVGENGMAVTNLRKLPENLRKAIDGVEFAPVFDPDGNYVGQAVKRIKLVGKGGSIELSAKVLGLLAPEKVETTVRASLDLNQLLTPGALEEVETIESEILED